MSGNTGLANIDGSPACADPAENHDRPQLPETSANRPTRLNPDFAPESSRRADVVKMPTDQSRPPDRLDAIARQIIARSSDPAVRAAGSGGTLHPIRGGFSGALVFKLESPDGSWAVRRWPDRALPFPRLRELHRWLAFLRREGIPVAVPIPFDDGQTTCHRDGLWQIEPWLSGLPDRNDPASPTRLVSAMHALARLHTLSGQYPATPHGAEWFSSRLAPPPAINERLALFARFSRMCDSIETQLRPALGHAHGLASGMLAAFRTRSAECVRQLTAFSSAELGLIPCLRDVWRDHVLFTGDAVTGLIDASAARTEHPASDLSRLLGSLASSDEHAREHALDAYSSVRPLGGAERRLVRVLDESGVLLSGMNWVQRLIDSPEGLTEPQLARLETFVSRAHQFREPVPDAR